MWSTSRIQYLCRRRLTPPPCRPTMAPPPRTLLPHRGTRPPGQKAGPSLQAMVPTPEEELAAFSIPEGLAYALPPGGGQ